MSNAFEKAKLPYYSAIMASFFGDEEIAEEADAYLREQGLRD